MCSDEVTHYSIAEPITHFGLHEPVLPFVTFDLPCVEIS